MAISRYVSLVVKGLAETQAISEPYRGFSVVLTYKGAGAVALTWRATVDSAYKTSPKQKCLTCKVVF